MKTRKAYAVLIGTKIGMHIFDENLAIYSTYKAAKELTFWYPDRTIVPVKIIPIKPKKAG